MRAAHLRERRRVWGRPVQGRGALRVRRPTAPALRLVGPWPPRPAPRRAALREQGEALLRPVRRGQEMRRGRAVHAVQGVPARCGRGARRAPEERSGRGHLRGPERRDPRLSTELRRRRRRRRRRGGRRPARASSPRADGLRRPSSLGGDPPTGEGGWVRGVHGFITRRRGALDGDPRRRRARRRGAPSSLVRGGPVALAFAITVGVAACAPRVDHPETAACPAGYAPDRARHAELLAHLAEDADARDAAARLDAPCFGPTRTSGSLVGARPLLDGNAPEVVLAARLAHLGVHVRDGIGDGCARGLDAARASEARAREVEARVRTRAGLAPLPADEQVDRDYIARCATRR